jgi:hypothetical protein
MSAIASFLGGGAFRAIWGEASAYLTKRQDHKHEVELMDKQAGYAAAEHARNLEGQRLQNELGIKVIDASRAAHSSNTEDDAWMEAVKGVNIKSGIAIIDGWNQGIRPAFATLVLVAMAVELYVLGWVMNDWYREFAGVVVGVYFADRSLKKRGK